MKKLATVIAAIALIGTPAFAADMAVKMPVKAPPPAPLYSWTGWYVGGNVGYSWGDANTDLSGNGEVITAFGPTNPVTPFAFGGPSNTAQLNGVIGGGQIGYNYQFSPNGVLGFEADFQGSGERGSGQFADTTIITAASFIGDRLLPFAALTNYEAKIDWFGTVRGRLGLLVGDRLLVYGTGGLAYGRVIVAGSSNVTASQNIPATSHFTPDTPALGDSATNVGFTVGGGMEGKFSYWLPANWTWKLEYLYLDLGSVDAITSFTLSQPTNVFHTITGDITTHTHFTDNIVRAGLNYQFH